MMTVMSSVMVAMAGSLFQPPLSFKLNSVRVVRLLSMQDSSISTTPTADFEPLKYHRLKVVRGGFCARIAQTDYVATPPPQT